MLNSLLIVLLLLFSIIIFLINDLLIISILFIISLLLCLIWKIHLSFYKSFIVILIINFVMNYLLGDLSLAILVILRLLIMFMAVNLIMKKLSIYDLGYALGNLFKSRELTLIITIALSFLPILSKELREIRNSLVTKNYPLTFKNILRKPNVFVTSFFNNLFYRVGEMEKVFISRGIE